MVSSGEVGACKQLYPPQSLVAPEAVPELHHTCRAYRPLSCCSAAASRQMVADDLEALTLPLACWPLMKALKCAVACSPEAVEWEWMENDPSLPKLCAASCVRYYSNCIATIPDAVRRAPARASHRVN